MALVHNFSGECWRDVSRSGQLDYNDPGMLLNDIASAKVIDTRPSSPHILSALGRIHGEFVLTRILSHLQAVKFFDGIDGTSVCQHLPALGVSCSATRMAALLCSVASS